MNLLNIEHVTKVFGEKVVFDDISFGVQEGEKIGIIGINGTGKTSLLKMIIGEEEPDKGQIIKQNGVKIAYLSQNPAFPENKTILECMKGYGEESEAKTILNRLGILNHHEIVDTLSGGQKKRVALARILVGSFDVLMMDEPTNHLDDAMISWLEDYLKRYKGVVLLVTHDRYFLDKVTNKILEIDHGKLYSYDANYSKFLEMKAEREEREVASERKRQSVLRMELEWAKRGCRARSTKQKARLERLERLKMGKAPMMDQEISIDSVQTRMGKKTIELHHVSKSYGEKKILEDFSYIVLRNQRLGIIGPNGCGKSTFLKMIAGMIQPDNGDIEIGETIRMGYFSQEVPDMNSSQKVIDYIRDVAEYIPTKEGKISASQMLERFLFTPQMQYAPIEKLSGGEKKRLYLLKIIFSAPNVLLFDEISNDLDIPTITILEDFLHSFSGIVIAVSHDRYFLDNVVDRIFAFEEEGKLRQYEGGYTDYLEARKRYGVKEEKMPGLKGNTGTGKDWKKNRVPKLKFTFLEQKEFETIDDDIAKLEEKIGELDGEMMKYATNSAKLSELLVEKEEAEHLLEEKMERWVYLNDLAERIQKQ